MEPDKKRSEKCMISSWFDWRVAEDRAVANHEAPESRRRSCQAGEPANEENKGAHRAGVAADQRVDGGAGG